MLKAKSQSTSDICTHLKKMSTKKKKQERGVKRKAKQQW
jgi:hypothetical protein